MDQLLAFLLITIIVIMVGLPTVIIIRDDVGDSTKSFLDFSNQQKKRISQQMAYTYISPLNCTTTDLEVRLVNNGSTDITFFAILLNGLPIDLTNNNFVAMEQITYDPFGAVQKTPKLNNEPIEIDDRITLYINNMTNIIDPNVPTNSWNNYLIIDEYGEYTSELQMVSNAGKLITLEIPMRDVYNPCSI